MKTKKDIEYSFNHVKDRFKERYDIDISRNDYDHLCDIIRSFVECDFLVDLQMEKGNYKVTVKDVLFEFQDDTQYVITLNFKNKDVMIVWSEIRDYITTVLPMPMYASGKRDGCKPSV